MLLSRSRFTRTPAKSSGVCTSERALLLRCRSTPLLGEKEFADEGEGDFGKGENGYSGLGVPHVAKVELGEKMGCGRVEFDVNELGVN